MTKPVLLLSDLHLPAAESPLRDAFQRFLEGPARRAQAVYILGDLFEYWVGDDVGLALYSREAAALKALTGTGVTVYFQHGNRDFLVGRRFATQTGISLLPDFHELNLGGQRVLLSHGDLYCTADAGYQRWRRFARNPLAQTVYLALPAALRERIAGGIRSQSAAGKSYKPADIMDVSEDAVRANFSASGVDRIIHGHTHRPADHRYEVDGKPRTRTVLADWRSGQPAACEVLLVDSAGFQRVTLS